MGSFFFDDDGKKWVTPDDPLPTETQLTNAEGEAIDDDAPLAVQQAQLTDANDEVRANAYVRSGGEWVSNKQPNASHPHQNATLADDSTSNIVTTSQAGGGAFRVHQFTMFSTIGGAFSLFDGAPSGTSNLLARFGVAENSQFTFDFAGLISVSAGQHLVIRNDTGSTASIVVQTNIGTGD